MVRYTQKEFKSILNVRKFADHWFWDKYSINPYNGCFFNCVYCDSRSTRYYMPDEFESDIIVKSNVGTMLDQRISRARTLLPDICGTGAACDPYQPAEEKFMNTLQCLEVLQKHNWPVHVITKSDLVLRDIDLLQKIGAKSWANVSVTITSADPEITSFTEKNAPTPQRRFEVIKKIKEQTVNVQCGVLLMPSLPGLTDSDGALEQMVASAKNANADYMLFGGGVTMRDKQAVWFLKHLNDSFPELIPQYEKLFGFNYSPGSYNGQYVPSNDYHIRLFEKFFSLCEKYDMKTRIPRFIPNDWRRYNYMISEKFLNRAWRLQMTGKHYNQFFWAGMNIQNLNESIVDVMKRGELKNIRNLKDKMVAYIIDFLEKNVEHEPPPARDLQNPTLF